MGAEPGASGTVLMAEDMSWQTVVAADQSQEMRMEETRELQREGGAMVMVTLADLRYTCHDHRCGEIMIGVLYLIISIIFSHPKGFGRPV